MEKLLTSCLVPSFSQHNLRLVVLGRCLLYVSMKFWDKFARLRQLNSPNSEDKFLKCIDMFDKIASKFHGILLFWGIFTGFHENEIFQVQKIMTMISHDPLYYLILSMSWLVHQTNVFNISQK